MPVMKGGRKGEGGITMTANKTSVELKCFIPTSQARHFSCFSLHHPMIPHYTVNFYNLTHFSAPTVVRIHKAIVYNSIIQTRHQF